MVMELLEYNQWQMDDVWCRENISRALLVDLVPNLCASQCYRDWKQMGSSVNANPMQNSLFPCSKCKQISRLHRYDFNLTKEDHASPVLAKKAGGRDSLNRMLFNLVTLKMRIYIPRGRLRRSCTLRRPPEYLAPKPKKTTYREGNKK